jgi:hypothetical protein
MERNPICGEFAQGDRVEVMTVRVDSAPAWGVREMDKGLPMCAGPQASHSTRKADKGLAFSLPSSSFLLDLIIRVYKLVSLGTGEHLERSYS